MKGGEYVFKDRLRTLRTEKDVTQAEVSKILGVGTTTINGYETGIIEYPPLDKLLKLSDYFNVSIDYLVGRTSIRTASQPNVNDVSEKLQVILDILSTKDDIVYYKNKLLTAEEKQLLITLLSNEINLINDIIG